MTQFLLKNAGFMPIFEFVFFLTVGISAGSAGLPRWQVCTLGEQSAPDCWQASHINSIADTIIIFIITTIAINIISTSSTIGTITKITHSLFYTWGQQPDCSKGRDFLCPLPMIIFIIILRATLRIAVSLCYVLQTSKIIFLTSKLNLILWNLIARLKLNTSLFTQLAS